MTKIILIAFAFVVALVASCSYMLYLNKQSNQVDNGKLKLSWRVYGLLGLSVVLFLFSVVAPYLFTQPALSNKFIFDVNTGVIGDTIGGIMNPFVALAGVIITGLAFYMQYEANRIQKENFNEQQADSKKQFKEQIDHQNNQFQQQINHQNEQKNWQQFESQFYEMVRLHRDNVSEMSISGYNFNEFIINEVPVLEKFDKYTEGRKCFVTMHRELEAIIQIYTVANGTLDEEGFRICYKIFFSGLDEFKTPENENSNLVRYLMDARLKHENYHNNMGTNKQRKEHETGAKLYFNYKPFSGHSERLGHYFRHLFLTVKNIVNSNVASNYSEKMIYLKILRAQLSNHEQLLLFYNWVSGYGAKWENEQNRFFTKYCMIHNLWHPKLSQERYIQDKVEYLRNIEAPEREGAMFEIDEA